jgi:hypothetical protein
MVWNKLIITICYVDNKVQDYVVVVVYKQMFQRSNHDDRLFDPSSDPLRFHSSFSKPFTLIEVFSPHYMNAYIFGTSRNVNKLNSLYQRLLITSK